MNNIDPNKFFHIKEEFDKIIKEIQYLLREINSIELDSEIFRDEAIKTGFELGDKIFSFSIDVAEEMANSTKDVKITLLTVLFGGLAGLAITTGSIIVGGTQNIITKIILNKKRKKIKKRKSEAENKLRETAEAKLPEIRNNIQFLQDLVSNTKKILYSDVSVKLSDENRKNNEHLISGVSNSFKSYVSYSYLLKLHKFVEMIYEDWEKGYYYKTLSYLSINSKTLLNSGIYYKEEEVYLFPQEINTQYDLSLELYNNCNFETIVTDEPTIGALFIANNGNDESIDFLTSAIAYHSLNKDTYLKKLLYKNRNNHVLKNSNLIEKFKKFEISYVKNIEKNLLKSTHQIFIISFVVSFIAVLNIEKYAYASIIPPLLISLGISFLSSIVWAIFAKVIFYSKTIFDNIDKVKLFVSLILLFALIPVSAYIYKDNYIKKFKSSNIEYINNIGTNILTVSNFIANKEFTNAYNKISKIALLKPYPIADIEESKQIVELKISLYDNIATNFVNNAKYTLSNSTMTIENYNYLFNIYCEKIFIKKSQI